MYSDIAQPHTLYSRGGTHFVYSADGSASRVGTADGRDPDSPLAPPGATRSSAPASSTAPEAVRAAELASKGDVSRAARAEAQTRAIANPAQALAALGGQAQRYFGADAPPGQLPASELRRLVSRQMACVGAMRAVAESAEVGRTGPPPKPFAEDPAAIAATVVEARFVTAQDGYDEHVGVPVGDTGGMLSSLSAARFYRYHQLVCDRCRVGFDAGCYVHVLCNGLAHGVAFRMKPDSEWPPELRRPCDDTRRLGSDSWAPRLRAVGGDAVETAKAEAASRILREYVRNGSWEELTPAQVSDPHECFFVSGVDVALRRAVALPSDLDELVAEPDMSAGGNDVDEDGPVSSPAPSCDSAALLAAAEATAVTFVDGFASRVAATRAAGGGASPDYAPIYDEAAQSLDSVAKYRPIVWLHRTVNRCLVRTSIEYASVWDLFGRVQRGWAVLCKDGRLAYHQVPVHPSFRRFLCVRHPVTGVVLRCRRIPMGLGPACSVFAMFMAEMKKWLAVLSPAAHWGPYVEWRAASAATAASVNSGGSAGAFPDAFAWARAASEAGVAPSGSELIVSGILDDVAQGLPSERVSAQLAFSDALSLDVCYTDALDKTRHGTQVLYRGAWLNTETMVAHVRPRKLASILLTALILQRLAASPCPFVSVRAFERFVGDVGWLSEFDRVLRLRMRGLYRSLHMAKAGRDGTGAVPYTCVNLRVLAGGRPPCMEDIDFLIDRARAGRIRGQRGVATGDVHAVSVNVALDAAGQLQAAVTDARAPSGRVITGVASDASIHPSGERVWATLAQGRAEFRRAAPGTLNASLWADEVELTASVDFCEQQAAAGTLGDGALVVILTDSLSNAFRMNSGRAAYGTHAHTLLTRLYESSDCHGFEFISVWVPRAANQLADAFSKCSSAAEAAAWAARAGLSFVSY